MTELHNQYSNQHGPPDTTRFALWVMLALVILTPDQQAAAEPYIAVQSGKKCVACHTSPSGGGKRNAYGNVYAQSELAARLLKKDEKGYNYWTGEIFKYLAIGGDIRGGWIKEIVPGQQNHTDLEVDEFLAYAEVRLIPQYLTFHLDAHLYPDDILAREKYFRLSTKSSQFYVKGGDFFLPYGFRLQDDTAFIRQIPGINFNTPDRGWEVGMEKGLWSMQLAVTRGTAGGPEIDSGKQYSLRASYVRSKWRLGGSFNFNDARVGDRQMQNIFAGLKTGRIAWLAEVDYIIDDGTSTGRRKLWISFVEANVAVKKGHNLKLTFEYFDPDIDVSEDQQNRISAVWEYFPIQFLQLRAGYRHYDGIPQNAAQNRELLFLELHVPF